MNNTDKVIDLWNDINDQNWNNIHTYFDQEAIINWNNTNEKFNAEEFVTANREYPGDWRIVIERLETINNLVISVVKVEPDSGDLSFHATSFFEFLNGKIKLLNEYWGEDGNPPQWRN